MAHAFYIVGSKEEGTAHARLSLKERSITDIDVLTYGLFSVLDARTIAQRAYRTSRSGGGQGIVIAVDRIFHEAQNALLKVFEEPPEGTLLILVVPSSGVLIPTLRSRLTELKMPALHSSALAEEFIRATKEARTKLIEKIVTKAKSEKQHEKDSARSEVRALVETLVQHSYVANKKNPSPELRALLGDLDAFIPILNERSAPLKLILEHISLVLPASLKGS